MMCRMRLSLCASVLLSFFVGHLLLKSDRRREQLQAFVRNTAGANAVPAWLHYERSVPLDRLKAVDVQGQAREQVLANMRSVGVPRLIHQTWRTSLIRADQEREVASMAAKAPGWTYVFWSDEDSRLLVQTLFPDFLATYDSYGHNVERSDAARYLFLEAFGGLYADLDVELLRSPVKLADAKRWVICPEPPAHRLEGVHEPDAFGHAGQSLVYLNAIMMSRRRHPIWPSVRARMKAEVARGTQDTLRLTGPMMLTEAMNAWTASGQKEYEADAHQRRRYVEGEAGLDVLPSTTFIPSLTKNNPRVWRACAAAFAPGGGMAVPSVARWSGQTAGEDAKPACAEEKRRRSKLYAAEVTSESWDRGGAGPLRDAKPRLGVTIPQCGSKRKDPCQDDFTDATVANHKYHCTWCNKNRKHVKGARPLRSLVPDAIPGRQLLSIFLSEFRGATGIRSVDGQGRDASRDNAWRGIGKKVGEGLG